MMSNTSLQTRNYIHFKQNPLGLTYFTKKIDLQLPKRASCVNHGHEGAAPCKAGLNLPGEEKLPERNENMSEAARTARRGPSRNRVCVQERKEGEAK